MTRTPNLEPISTRLQRIATLAREDPQRCLTTLSHHIDESFLREAFYRTRQDGAPGVDGQTWLDYAKDLGENLQDLLNRFKSGRYKAPPVRRVYIPKGGDPTKKRPIGIPTLEDKVLQRAVLMILEAVYEQDFLDCSYGFRPGRSAHQGLKALRDQLMAMHGGVVYEADICSFYDELHKPTLRKILDQRVRDGVLRRTIDKWLKAGVMEEGTVYHPEKGTPQGGVISPILSNIYLHEVLDRWFEEAVKPRLRGQAFLIRFADDFVLGFQNEHDAARVSRVLPKRLAKHGLRLHPEKTRFIPFRRPRRKPSNGGKGPRPGSRSFDFLGFTHFWAKSRRGNWVIKRKTGGDRMSRTLRRINQWCARHRHEPVAWQHEKISRSLRGHYGYFGITGNSEALWSLRHWVERIWKKWLGRRSHKDRLTWDRFGRFLKRYPLPQPRTLHAV